MNGICYDFTASLFEEIEGNNMKMRENVPCASLFLFASLHHFDKKRDGGGDFIILSLQLSCYWCALEELSTNNFDFGGEQNEMHLTWRMLEFKI